MKVLIGYDDSPHADAAIDDLGRAGLPESTEITVLTVADVWPHLPPSSFQPLDPQSLAQLSPSTARAHELARQAMAEAVETSSHGAQRIQAAHPTWKLHAATAGGSPASAIVAEAQKWNADLIVIGSHGRGVLSRFVLGSVSRSVVNHAACSVRVVRSLQTGSSGPVRIVVGVDGSDDSRRAVRTLSKRFWPEGTEVHVVAVLDLAIATVIPTTLAVEPVPPMISDDQWAWIRNVAESAASELSSDGLSAAPLLLEGDPRRVLLNEAEQWGADCIFLGAKGHTRLERLLIGSVSAAIAVRAHCSVEIVR